jgi:hypothetical protein
MLSRRSSVQAKAGEDTNYINPHEFAKGGKRFSFAHETPAVAEALAWQALIDANHCPNLI